MALDQYFALRRQHQANSQQVPQVSADPQSHHGAVIELRGTITGLARNGEQACLILNCSSGSYIISTDTLPETSTGSQVCALVRVGEKCATSLSDLRLVALASQREVIERERKAVEAEAAKKARRAAELSRRQAESRLKRSETPPSHNVDLVAIYQRAIKNFNRKLSDAEAEEIAQSIIGFGARYQVDPRLVCAVILAESNFRPDATSPKGAMGLGQLMPRTASGLGVSHPYDPVENVAGSVRLIRGHLDRLSGNARWTELTWQDLALALASYNAGPGAVRKYGGVPPYRETRNYIKKVFSIYRRLCGAE